MVAAEATMAAENFGLKPLSTIALYKIWPKPAASAMADPDIPEKITLAMTQTCPSPPGTWPTTALANRNIRLVTPPVFIRFPARIKNGIARRVKPVVEAYILWGSMVRSEPLPKPTKNVMAVRAMATAMGTLIMIKISRTRKIIKVSIPTVLLGDCPYRQSKISREKLG